MACYFAAIKLGKGARLKLLGTICLPSDERFLHVILFYYVKRKIFAHGLFFQAFVVHWSAGLVHRYKLLNGIQSGLCVFIEILYHTGTRGGDMSLVEMTDMGFIPVSISGYIVYPSKGAAPSAHANSID